MSRMGSSTVEPVCPRAHLHTKHPDGYVAFFEWAEKKARRHYQVRCPGCGRWAIWKRKAVAGRGVGDG